ncbi:Spi protease inhibitor [Dysgonomonas alginatilytica]|uniref:Spi protease inhibitor n=1 Tax=Dysgonomonas alginatilytica TaxID=1605892 RepID=A0A2V3PQT8_9BACT|nr:C10 family peptidase [Dysgonomonas alginatilytica]PXV64159.1 Spi protease inhibitor [Dysgonomonas alginatilytica]
MRQRKILLLSLVCLFLLSCNKADDIAEITQTDKNFIEQRVAVAFANMIEFPVDPKDSTSTRSTRYLEVDNITPFGDSQKPSYYIINYKDNNGYLILAADNRVYPLLAYSTSGTFQLDYQDMPGGLVEWMSDTNKGIENIRKEGALNTRSVNNQTEYILDPDHPGYNPCLIQHIIGVNPQLCPENTCKEYYTRIEPLLKTRWSQWDGYNDLIPGSTCPKVAYNPQGKYPAGCVAIAMAQVMKYYEYPKTYNWSLMAEERYQAGALEAARLIKDIGSNLNMDYGCDGSGSHINKIPDVLKNKYGYRSATYTDIDLNTICNEIIGKRPVILQGGRKSNGIFPFIYKDGHAWVCDGINRFENCRAATLYLHMNWGWAGQEDGWYACNDWSPGSDSYNYMPKMVYNIRPQ